MVRRYVTDYNAALTHLAMKLGDRMLALRTDELHESQTENRLSEFLGRRVTMPARSLNAGNATDSNDEAFLL